MSEENRLLTPVVCHDIGRQVEVLEMHFFTWELLRQMTRQEFRTLLRERLQEFGDQCLAVWEKECGEKE